ncbi:MAG: DNA topoisomerase IV subunit A, partial [Duodenibacillus sp.]|nr:DNA topoisomerase IV subunit A [Duodenibacillus sp.]
KVRLVFEPRTAKIDRGAFAQALLASTSLECSAPMNLVMIGGDGRPRQKALREILCEWIEARKAAVTARTKARLAKVNERLHILDGRLIAFDNLERVIEIVRFDPEPKKRLMAEFSLSDVQAEDILELRLRQLASLEAQKLIAERDKLLAEKAQLERILASDKVLKGVIARETREAARLYGDARRTLIEEAERAGPAAAPAASDPVTVVVSAKGYVRSRAGHGHDASLMSFKMGDRLACAFECMSDDTLVAVGSQGRVYNIAVSSLPGSRGDGLPATSFIDLEPRTEVFAWLMGAPEERVLFASSAGQGFACAMKDLAVRNKAGKAFVKLEEGARLLACRKLPAEAQRIACLASDGKLLAFPASELPERAAGGKGVALMKLAPGAELLSALPADERGVVVRGQGKTKARSKALGRLGLEQHAGARGAKGKPLAVLFAPTSLSAPEAGAAADDAAGDPSLFA